MGQPTTLVNRRILIVDDHDGIHHDFRQILEPLREGSRLCAMEEALFGEPFDAHVEEPQYELTSAYQGKEGLQIVEDGVRNQSPYALAFVDVRMPPGWDGVETTHRLWQVDPRLQVVMCTAFSDYDWSQITRRLGCSEQLLILKKPFEPIEVKQLACALIRKWNLALESAQRMDALQSKQAELERLYLQAEQASRLKDEFLAMVSHELRNPLHVLMGHINLLSRRNLSSEQVQKVVEKLVHNIKMQAQLVDDLLDSSRSITGNLRITPAPSDIEQIVRSAVESLAGAAAGKHLRIDMKIEPGLPLVWLDPGRVGQIVSNLLSNAIKFTPAGGWVNIAVAAEQGKIKLSVCDNGEGLSADAVPHIFERFRQADSSITRQHGGLGLGLSIVRHLVELHGGSVLAHSPGPGQGATFTVELPLVIRAAGEVGSAGS